MKAVLSLSSFAMAAFAVLAGCHRGQLALIDHPRSFPGVVSKDVTFYSSALDRNMMYRVYLPRDISAGTRLPAVYLLHGCGTSFRDWSNYSDVGAYAAKGFIVVMVDGECSYSHSVCACPSGIIEHAQAARRASWLARGGHGHAPNRLELCLRLFGRGVRNQ